MVTSDTLSIEMTFKSWACKDDMKAIIIDIEVKK